MKWKILLFVLFPATVVSFSTGIMGRWRPNHSPNVMIHVMEEKVVGTMDDRHSVEMTIVKQDAHEICLDNLQLKQKPFVWFDVIKYREYVEIFRKIRQCGIVCQYVFLDENIVEISSTIGEEHYRFILEKRENNGSSN